MAESQGEKSDKESESKGSTDKLFNKFLTEVKLIAFVTINLRMKVRRA